MMRTAMRSFVAQFAVWGLVTTALSAGGGSVAMPDVEAGRVALVSSIEPATNLAVAARADAVVGRSDPSLGVYERTGAWILRLSSSATRAEIEQRVRASGGKLMFWLGELSMAVVSGVSAADARGWRGVESVVPDISLPLPLLRPAEGMSPQNGTQPIVASPIAQQQWNMRQIRADVAIDKGHTGKDVVVAVIDTGIFAEHPDLVGNVLIEQGRNLYAPYFSCAGTPLGDPPDDPSTGDCPALERPSIPLTAGDPNNTTDDNGHGTYMAGLIAAHGGEHGTGMIGVAPEAKLLPVRVCSTEGFCPMGAVAAGIAFAVQRGATIANVALNAVVDVSTPEGAEFFQIFNDVLDFAFDNGLTIIGTAGNGSTDFDKEPTRRPLIGWHDNVVTVTGVGPTGRLSSNLDPQGNITFQRPTPFVNTGSYIDMAGPGGDFIFTKPNDIVISTSSPIVIVAAPLYSVAAGTSTGTAHVAGVAAQVMAELGPQKPEELMKMLYGGTIDLGPRGGDPETGHGLTDVPRTLGLD